jgi:hypothetical protein
MEIFNNFHFNKNDAKIISVICTIILQQQINVWSWLCGNYVILCYRVIHRYCGIHVNIRIYVKVRSGMAIYILSIWFVFMLSLVYFYFFGRDRMVVGFTTTYAISAFHHWSCEFESLWWRGVLDTTVCDKVCQWLVVDRDFSLGSPVSSTNKTDHHDMNEILLKWCWIP